MDYKPRFLSTFRADLAEILEYYVRFSQRYAQQLLNDVEKSAEVAAEFPEMAKRYKSYRVKIIKKRFLAFYKVNRAQKTVDFYRLIDGRRDYDKTVK